LFIKLKPQYLKAQMIELQSLVQINRGIGIQGVFINFWGFHQDKCNFLTSIEPPSRQERRELVECA